MNADLTQDSLWAHNAMAHCGNFTAAVDEQLGPHSRRPMPYVLQKLEDGLKVALFGRRGHRAQLIADAEV